MARTKKCRRVCCRPACRRFRAQSGTRSVNIPLDELEAMRLVDLEHLEQGEASEKMGVSRGTVQRLLRAGREKLISALVSGWHIVIPDGDFGETDFDGLLSHPVPIRAVLGDSHGSLLGQGCLQPGMVKATYGTGSSVMMNIGKDPAASSHGLVTSIAWKRGGTVDYVLEGNLNYTGAVITWLKDNLGLVHACANRFRNKGIEYDDLFSAGCLGLVKAADGFDESRGFAFSTYAVPAILGEMKRLFRDGGAVKISRALKERAREAAKLREEMTAALSREPTLRELAAKMQVSEYEMAQLVNLSMPVASLTELHEENDRQIDIPVESEEEEIQNKLALSEVLKILPENDRRLIELRYYKGLTQTKTAEILGLSQVQVSRRERTILLELRRKLTG